MVKSLRTQFAGLCFFIFALVTQVNHAQVFFYHISHRKGLDQGSSWVGALALESTVLYAVVNGKKNASYLFAAISIAINVAYYEFAMVEGESMWWFSQFHDTWPKWLSSFIVPVGLAFYSHVFASRLVEEDETNFAWFKNIADKIRTKFKGTAPVFDDLVGELEVVGEAQTYPLKIGKRNINTKEMPSEKHEAIIKYLQENGIATLPKISEGTGIAPMTLKRKDKEGNPKGYLEDLLSNHLISSSKKGKAIEYTLNGVHG